MPYVFFTEPGSVHIWPNRRPAGRPLPSSTLRYLRYSKCTSEPRSLISADDKNVVNSSAIFRDTVLSAGETSVTTGYMAYSCRAFDASTGEGLEIENENTGTGTRFFIASAYANDIIILYTTDKI